MADKHRGPIQEKRQPYHLEKSDPTKFSPSKQPTNDGNVPFITAYSQKTLQPP